MKSVSFGRKPLTLARTCYFPILGRTWGRGCNPHVISPLIEIELWDKDQTHPWDVVSPMIPELTSLGHILTPPGRVQEKRWRFEDLRVFANNFQTKKDSGIIQAPSSSLFKTHRNIYLLTSEGQVENLTSGQSNMMIDLSWPWPWSWPWYNVWSHFLIQGRWSLQSTASVLYQTRNQHRIR